jgi:hypothetical protein
MLVRLNRWFTFAVAFALLPFVTSILFRRLAGVLTIDAVQQSPELLFFSLMICAAALGDLNEFTAIVGKDPVMRVLGSAMLIGAAFAGILYGGFVYAALPGQTSGLFQRNLFQLSLILAPTSLFVATVVQVMIAKTEAT